MTYRFNACAPFAIGPLAGLEALNLGVCRRICERSLNFFLRREITQEQGLLGIGWWDTFPQVAEPYSCAASVYWAAKPFSALMMKSDHPFWTTVEGSIPAEAGDFVHRVPKAGLIFRGVGGEVELLNAGTEICAGNRDRFGAYKWGKLAYRTGVGFCLGDPDHYSLDGGLTATDMQSLRRFGRHYATPLAQTISGHFVQIRPKTPRPVPELNHQALFFSA